ncbi:MAG: DUF2956 domain-containing protein [Pseudomonadota bacterium]
MAKYKQNKEVSAETIDQANKIANGIKKPNQTKEQTRRIAQGIQKGIVEFKKQQKVKARDQEKLKKKKIQQETENSLLEKPIAHGNHCKIQWLPWALLLISWIGMGLFILWERG